MENLSHMLPASTGLTGGESMNGANMTSNRPDSLMSAPGSEPVLPLSALGMGSLDNPCLEVPAVQDFRPLVDPHGKKTGE